MGTGAEAAALAAARAALLEAARDGDVDSFVELVTPHRRAVHVHCYRMLGSLDAAGEATAEALLRARHGLRGYRGEHGFHPWLLRVATVTCLRADIRRSRRRPGPPAAPECYPATLLDQLTGEGPDPAADPAARATLAPGFVAALQRVPGTQRAAALLSDVLGWPVEDVAWALGVPAGVAARAIERARESLAGTP